VRISAKLKNMNTWNPSERSLASTMQWQTKKVCITKTSTEAFMVKLKGYDFICGSLKLKNMHCENISLGLFAPMDDESIAFKDRKQNNDKKKDATKASIAQSKHTSVV
jgi:hypothetical protein